MAVGMTASMSLTRSARDRPFGHQATWDSSFMFRFSFSFSQRLLFTLLQIESAGPNSLPGKAVALCILLLASAPTAASGNGPPATQWNITYSRQGSVGAYGLVETDDGGYAMVGYTRSYGSGSDDVWLVKVDSGGQIEWSQTYGGASEDAAYALVQTGDGGCALAGETNISGDPDSWLLKVGRVGSSPGAGWVPLVRLIVLALIVPGILVAVVVVELRRAWLDASRNS